jgi:hypothetical protein
VMVGWRAVRWADFDDVLALSMVHSYLTESEVSLGAPGRARSRAARRAVRRARGA